MVMRFSFIYFVLKTFFVNMLMEWNTKNVTVQGKKYTGAAGEFALEMPKRAPEIVQKSTYEGDIKTVNRPRNCRV